MKKISNKKLPPKKKEEKESPFVQNTLNNSNKKTIFQSIELNNHAVGIEEKASGLFTADSIVNIEANNQELTFEQLKTLYAGNNLTLRENTFQRDLNLLTRDGTYNLMAGILADENSF